MSLRHFIQWSSSSSCQFSFISHSLHFTSIFPMQKKQNKLEKRMKKEQEKGSSTHHHDESCALFQQCIQLVVEIVGEVQQTMIRQLDEAFDQMVLGARQVNACDCVFDDDGQLVARVMKREVDEEKKLQGHLEESTSQHSNKWIPLGKTSAQVEKVEKVEGFSKTGKNRKCFSVFSFLFLPHHKAFLPFPGSTFVFTFPPTFAHLEPFRSIVPPSPSTSSTSTSASTSLSLPSAAAAAAAAIADNSAVVQRALALKQRLIKVLASMNRPPPQVQQQQQPQLYRSIPVLQPCKRRRLESSSFVTIQADDDQQIDRPKLPPPPPPPVATLPSTQPSSHHPHKQSIPPVQSFQPSQTSKKDVTFDHSNHNNNNNNNKKIISPCKPIPQKPPPPPPPPKPSSTPSFTGGVRCPVSGCPSPPLGDIFKYYSHLYSMHLRRDLHCPVAGCPTSFGTFSLSLLAHHDDRRHASEKKELLQAERRCPRCPLTFSSFTSAAFHAFDVHARGRWVCQRVVVVTEKKGESQLQGVVCNYVATTRREWLLHEEQCNKAATTSTTSSTTTSTTPTTTTTASSTPMTTTKSTTTISSSISIDTVETDIKTAESTK